MSRIDLLQARRIALERLTELEKEAGCKLELVENLTVSVAGGWVFFYNSSDFLRTGDISDALAGNGPLFVSLEGSLRELPSSRPWQQCL